jgi:1-deoxy-D-xylulose-5-phosphate synthase
LNLSPDAIRSLSLEELEALAGEIRREIIDVMAKNGGHLASSLGATELTLALHRTFFSPEDKFIFDVSHQTYPHKIITGRGALFPTIRQFKGLCGFSSPKESPHDHFYAGHAGTALSLALGMAKNRDLTKRSEHVVAILGDASFSCGLTLEALNNIPKNLGRFLVILNDNKMSISENVGAMTEIMSHPEIASFFFRQFGLTYFGPIDGHDLTTLTERLSHLRDLPYPILLHVHTIKGRGMETASENPVSWHGCKPFDKVTGKFHPSSGRPTFPQIFGRHIVKMAENDPSLVTVTPAMAAGSCLETLMRRFPDRCLDLGIAEGHVVTFGGGIAYGKKMKVVVSIYATFLQRAFDNLFHDVCLQELPVVFAIDRAGISAADGSTHHGLYDIGFLNAMPNMVICQPRNGHLLKELLESSFHWMRPTAIRYPNMATDEPDLPIQSREIGAGEVLLEGKDLLIVALGHMCGSALKIAELLLKEGVSATVVDPIFVKPLDTDLFCRLLLSHKYVVTLEEHAVSSGLGMIFDAFMLRSGFTHIPTLNFGIPDTFVEHGSYGELMGELGLDPASIARQIVRHFDLVPLLPLESPP